MALTEDQDRDITVMRENLASLDNEGFINSVNVHGAANTVALLVGMLPDDARKALFQTLKVRHPADFA